MDAIVPAAGEGTRLRPTTAETPKPLVEVGGTPVLGRCFDQLLALGTEKLVVVIGYEGEQIVDRFGDAYRGVPVEYVTQPERKGIAHALALARDRVDGDVAMMLGDNVFERPPRDVVDAYRRGDADVAFPVESVSREQAVEHTVCELDGNREVVALREKPDEPVSTLVMTGFVVAGAELLDACGEIEPSDRGEYELADAIARLLERGRTVRAYPLEGRRVNVNTAEDVAAAERLVE